MGLKDNKDKIRRAFMSYVRHAVDILTQPQSLKEKLMQGSIHVAYIAPVYRLRSLVEKLESSPSFKKLSLAVEQALDKNQLPSGNTSSALENFFKRSHFYTDTYDNKNPKQELLFELFWSSLPTRKVRTTRLRLMNGVLFESKTLDFDLFRIHKFTKQELDGLIDRQIRDVFYPQAKLDTDFVSQFWFILEESVAEHNLGLGGGLILPFGDLERNVPDRVIQLLALHEATAEWSRWGPDWTGLTLPFSFEVDNDLFEGPASTPEMPRYLHPPEPTLREELEEFNPIEGIIEHIECVFDGEIEFDRESELYLKNIIDKVQKVLKVTAVVDDWNFIEIAMGYLGKAFVTHEGLDYILWHIAVLDALLSEENASVRQVMRRRIGNILGASEGENKDLRKQFDELYAFRSDLVHGKKYTKKAQSHHLANARQLARKALLWFIDYVLWIDENLRQRKVSYEQYPKRKELLSVLDFDNASLDRLNRLIGILPEEFPKL